MKNGVQLKCEANVVQYLQQNLSTSTNPIYSTKVRDISQVFWEVKIDEVKRDRSWDCQNIPKICVVHFFHGITGECQTRRTT